MLPVVTVSLSICFEDKNISNWGSGQYHHAFGQRSLAHAS